jgi:succinate dehydrogenase/fumarate reductase flavoprotein subunit
VRSRAAEDVLDCVIVGAGAAGLAAATTLREDQIGNARPMRPVLDADGFPESSIVGTASSQIRESATDEHLWPTTSEHRRI